MIGTCLLFIFGAQVSGNWIYWTQLNLPIVHNYQGNAENLVLKIEEFDCRSENVNE